MKSSAKRVTRAEKPQETRSKKPPQETRAEKPSESASAPASKPSVDREKLRARAVGLVARAAHASTPEEEARTSAVVAAKLIHVEKLLEVSPGRHALLERLDALEDDVLNDLALLVEEALDVLEAGGTARATSQASLQVSRWRNEAKHLQRKLDALAGSLRWILQGYKLGLAERPGQCGICGRPLQLGDIVVWKRRRVDAVHYQCCVAALQHHGAIPTSEPVYGPSEARARR